MPSPNLLLDACRSVSISSYVSRSSRSLLFYHFHTTLLSSSETQQKLYLMLNKEIEHIFVFGFNLISKAKTKPHRRREFIWYPPGGFESHFSKRSWQEHRSPLTDLFERALKGLEFKALDSHCALVQIVLTSFVANTLQLGDMLSVQRCTTSASLCLNCFVCKNSHYK